MKKPPESIDWTLATNFFNTSKSNIYPIKKGDSQGKYLRFSHDIFFKPAKESPIGEGTFGKVRKIFSQEQQKNNEYSVVKISDEHNQFERKALEDIITVNNESLSKGTILSKRAVDGRIKFYTHMLYLGKTIPEILTHPITIRYSYPLSTLEEKTFYFYSKGTKTSAQWLDANHVAHTEEISHPYLESVIETISKTNNKLRNIDLEYFCSYKLAAPSPKSDSERIDLGVQIAIKLYRIHEGLDSKTATKWIHKDIKPSNITWHESLGINYIDYGFASTKNELHNEYVGSTMFLPSRKISNNLTNREVDIFALWSTLLFRKKTIWWKGKDNPIDDYYPHACSVLTEAIVSQCNLGFYFDTDSQDRIYVESIIKQSPLFFAAILIIALHKAYDSIAYSSIEKDPKLAKLIVDLYIENKNLTPQKLKMDVHLYQNSHYFEQILKVDISKVKEIFSGEALGQAFIQFIENGQEVTLGSVENFLMINKLWFQPDDTITLIAMAQI